MIQQHPVINWTHNTTLSAYLWKTNGHTVNTSDWIGPLPITYVNNAGITTTETLITGVGQAAISMVEVLIILMIGLMQLLIFLIIQELVQLGLFFVLSIKDHIQAFLVAVLWLHVLFDSRTYILEHH